jgi:hypothetical protein
MGIEAQNIMTIFAILQRIPIFRHGCALMDIEAQNTATV